MPERIFKAEVNGKTRQVLIWMDPPYVGDVEEAEDIVMNDEHYYNLFYEGATPADYAAPLENPRVTKVRFK